MTYGAFTARDFDARGFAATARGRSGRIVGPQGLPCAIALALAASAGLWFLYGPPAGITNAPVPTIQAPLAARQAISTPDERSAAVLPRVVLPAATPPLRRYASLLDPALTSGFKPVTFALSAPLHAGFEPARPVASNVVDATSVANAPTPANVANASVPDRVAIAMPLEPRPSAQSALPLPAIATRDIPMPAPRPASFLPAYEAAVHAGATRHAPTPATTVAATTGAAPDDHRSFFDKLFTPARQPSTVLAYASPEDGIVGNRPSGGFGGLLTGNAGPDRATAVYDIAAHTVTLPDGTKLEAHSGLGASLDDPRSVTKHMRGATPPNVYDLQPREQLFHGVRALRLNPTGGTTYGRAGLLAHTFMLGPRGDSNGCVVFRNYQAFLAAYESGQVKRLAVVLGSR